MLEPLDDNERREFKSWIKTQHLLKKKLYQFPPILKKKKNSTFKKLILWHPVPSLHGKRLRGWSGNGDQFCFVGLKIHCSDCSCAIKRHLLLERKAMANLDSLLKSRLITLPTKVCIVRAIVFPVVMYGCESRIIKQAERQRTGAFEVWCWRRSSRVLWMARRSNQSILKEINPEYSLGRLILKLKLHYFGHLIWRVNLLEKTLMLEKIEGRRRRGQQRIR